MALENLLKILLAGGSLTAGAFLTALRAKLANTKQKNWLHIVFYVVSGIVVLGVILTLLVFWKDILKPDWFAVIVLAIGLIFSVALIWVTNRFLTGKYQYTTDELDPVVNKFSRNADKDNIKLLAGKLDFFGTSAQEMNKHPQYKCLREMSFQAIQVLCKPPVQNEDKFRYGKILTDFPFIELRYYRPVHADLKVRGRIKTLNNVTRLLIYSKIEHEKYEALELNTADNDGALYTHLWNLIWGLADPPSSGQIAEYKSLYNS